jgi:hypothetical protein
VLRLPHNLAGLARLAARDAGKYGMQAVKVIEHPDGYEVQATDGKRLGVVKGPGKVNVEEGENDGPDVDRAADDATPHGAPFALVPAKEFAEIVRDAKKLRAGSLVLVLGTDVTSFVTPDSSQRVHNQEGRFPDFDVVLPKKKAQVAFTANATLMADLLQVAATFTRGQEGSVTFYYWKPDVPIALLARNELGQEFLGLLMPMSTDPDPLPTVKEEPKALPPPEEEKKPRRKGRKKPADPQPECEEAPEESPEEEEPSCSSS